MFLKRNIVLGLGYKIVKSKISRFRKIATLRDFLSFNFFLFSLEGNLLFRALSACEFFLIFQENFAFRCAKCLLAQRYENGFKTARTLNKNFHF